MTLRFGINGVGRIGRALLRLAHGREELVPAAVNDLTPAGTLARLLARDTVHGPFPGTVAATAGGLVIGGPRGSRGPRGHTPPGRPGFPPPAAPAAPAAIPPGSCRSSPRRSPGASPGRAPGWRW